MVVQPANSMYSFREREVQVTQQAHLVGADKLGDHIAGLVNNKVTMAFITHIDRVVLLAQRYCLPRHNIEFTYTSLFCPENLLTMPDDDDIKTHLALWLQGNEDAFKQVFAYYYPRLKRYMFRYLKSEPWAEDVAMDVLVRVWEKKSAIRPAATFENYLFTAARNTLINHWQRKVDTLLSLETTDTDQKQNAPHDPLLSKEMESVYHNSLSVLPLQRRIIYNLHRNEQLSYKEIAHKLNISPKTVENQIGAALKHLRSAMLQYLKVFL